MEGQQRPENFRKSSLIVPFAFAGVEYWDTCLFSNTHTMPRFCLHAMSTTRNPAPPAYESADHFGLEMLRSWVSPDAWRRLASWLEHRCTKPSWIVARQPVGTPVQALVLLTHPHYGIPLEGIWFPELASEQAIDEGLLRQAIDCAKRFGARELFFSGPEIYLKREQPCDFRAGPWREVLIYESAAKIACALDNYQVIEARFLPRSEIISLVERTSAGSDDSQTKHFQHFLGDSADARLTLEVLELAPHESSWWLVAVDQTGRKVGLVLPVLNYGELTIGFVGVLPDLRGRGIARFLLAQFLAIANLSGYPAVYAEVDAKNRSMQRTASQSGFRLIRRKREWRVTF
jgi:GNAT superfamily N-acetyltransferase